jgi:hypothetical protein
MMTLFSRKPIIAGACLLAMFCAGRDFKEKKIDHDLLLKQEVYTIDPVLSPLKELSKKLAKQLPAELVEPKQVIFYAADQVVTMVLYKSGADAKTFDRLIVAPSKLVRNLAQVPVLKLDANLSADVKLPSPKGGEEEYRLYVVKTPKSDCGWNVALLPVTCTEGTVTLEGKPVRALLRKYSEEKYLIIDLDSNGTFEAKEVQEPCPVTSIINIKDGFYTPVTGKEDSDLDLTPYQGPFGEVSMTGDLFPKERPLFLRMVMMNPQSVAGDQPPQGFILNRVLTNQTVSFKVPAGTYEIFKGVLTAGNDKNETVFSVEPVDFLPAKPVVLTLNKPVTELHVSQKGRVLGVQRIIKYTSTPKITYSSVAGDSDLQPLTVDVVNAADPQKVLIGKKNMEYG